jgi:hypothetical protein
VYSEANLHGHGRHSRSGGNDLASTAWQEADVSIRFKLAVVFPPVLVVFEAIAMRTTASARSI